MSEMIMQFGSFSQGQFMFLGFFLLTLLYAGIRMVSLVAIVSWSFTAISLIGVMEYSLDMIYFWFTAMITVIAISIAMGIRTIYNTRV